MANETRGKRFGWLVRLWNGDQNIDRTQIDREKLVIFGNDNEEFWTPDVLGDDDKRICTIDVYGVADDDPKAWDEILEKQICPDHKMFGKYKEIYCVRYVRYRR